MQFRVNASVGGGLASFSMTNLTNALPKTYANKPVTMDLKPMSINDGFDPIHGSLFTMLGVALPNTPCTYAASTGVTDGCPIPYNQFDPPTEIYKNGNVAAQIGTLADGQSSGDQPYRTAGRSDKAARPNELGWRETIRANPLEDTIVALRPIKPDPI